MISSIPNLNLEWSHRNARRLNPTQMRVARVLQQPATNKIIQIHQQVLKQFLFFRIFSNDDTLIHNGNCKTNS